MRYGNALLRMLAIFVLAAILGGLGTAARTPNGHVLRSMATQVPRCELHGKVAERAGELGVLIQIEHADCADAGVVTNAGNVIVDAASLPPGARVATQGWLLPLDDDGYGRAQRRVGALATFETDEIEIIEPPSGLLGVAAAVRGSLNEATRAVTNGRGAALLQGLTIGETRGLDEQTQWQFRRTGLSHLVAVSGSNVAIVVGAAAFAARRLGLRFQLVFCGLALLGFVIVVGPEPSVLRAGAMGGIALIALACGRRSEPLHALLFAVLIVIALRPTLVASVGLHLSVAATAGLVVWGRPLADRFATLLPNVIAFPLAATIAAQAAVVPIIAGVFGEISLVAPLANVLAAPAVPPATVLGVLAGMVGLFNAGVAGWLAQAGSLFATWILTVAERLSGLTGAAVSSPRWLGLVLAGPVVYAAWRSLVGPSSGPLGPYGASDGGGHVDSPGRQGARDSTHASV